MDVDLNVIDFAIDDSFVFERTGCRVYERDNLVVICVAKANLLNDIPNGITSISAFAPPGYTPPENIVCGNTLYRYLPQGAVANHELVSIPAVVWIGYDGKMTLEFERPLPRDKMGFIEGFTLTYLVE